ncbi:hypothetical protein [Halotalea alkalilenta]|uniref:hypothetical protein n=1 Tax=Halotalea alkalilenta TaxID=376489 RepID=UPI0012DFD78D|nr:hypothetical protein [Halotalea alkalilenta]
MENQGKNLELNGAIDIIRAAADRANSASFLYHDFIHADENSIINTESGPLPSLAHLIRNSILSKNSKICELLHVNDAQPYYEGGHYNKRDLISKNDITYIALKKFESTNFDQDLREKNLSLFEITSNDQLNKLAFTGSSSDINIDVNDNIATLSDWLENAAPTIILDRATTSWAGIKSKHPDDDLADNLNQLFNDKKNVVVDTPIYVNKSIIASLDRQLIIGTSAGLLLAGKSMQNSPILNITGNRSTIKDLSFDNPHMVASTQGGRQGAISISADNVTVINCNAWKMLHAFSTASNGEWFNTKFMYCNAFECIGVGAGPEDDGTSNFGEDRGDAFSTWGSTGYMIGCYAQMMNGQDGRIAFHAEGLPKSHTRSTPNSEADFIISNCMAEGSFRRHFVFEGVDRGIINSCISRGGATWWSMAISQSKNIHISSIVINHDRNQNETQGASWTPRRAAIAMMNWSQSITFSDMTVVLSANNQDRALTSIEQSLRTSGPDGHENTVIQNSIFSREGDRNQQNDSTYQGLDIRALNQPKLVNLKLNNFNTAIYALHTKKGFYSSNIEINNSDNGYLIKGHRERGKQNYVISGGIIRNTRNCIQADFASTVSINDLLIINQDATSIIDINRADNITIHGVNSSIGEKTHLFIDGKNDGIRPASITFLEGNICLQHNFKMSVAHLADINHNVNHKNKHPGLFIFCDNNLIYYPEGSTPGDTWRAINGERITPN